MASSSLGKTLIVPALTQTAKASIYFLHGTCDTGHGFKNWVTRIRSREFNFKDCNVVYPSAPTRPYYPMNGKPTAAWFNRLSLCPASPEDELSLAETGQSLVDMIAEEKRENPGRKVFVGGFSTGGCMALHVGYKLQTDLTGVFALSSFLPETSSVFSTFTEEDKKGKKMPKLFMSLGLIDPLAQPTWIRATFKKFLAHDVDGFLYTFPRQSHEVTKIQLDVLHNWIVETLADAEKEEPVSNKAAVKKEVEKPLHVDTNTPQVAKPE